MKNTWDVDNPKTIILIPTLDSTVNQRISSEKKSASGLCELSLE